MNLTNIFTKCHSNLTSRLYKILGNYDDVSDALQNTFVKCWQIRDKLTNIQDVESWIFRVGMNAARDLQRNRWMRIKNNKKLLLKVVGLPCESLEKREDQEQLEKATTTLRIEEKEVFIRRRNGFKFQDIANELKLPIGTVKTRWRLATSNLKFKLRGK